jgi:heme/copper-type cytochrome/quinol oxidase subunit 1
MGAVFAVFLGTYMWFKLMTGHMFDSILGQIHF